MGSMGRTFRDCYREDLPVFQTVSDADEVTGFPQ